jgi:hypothetical protein
VGAGCSCAGGCPCVASSGLSCGAGGLDGSDVAAGSASVGSPPACLPSEIEAGFAVLGSGLPGVAAAGWGLGEPAEEDAPCERFSSARSMV